MTFLPSLRAKILKNFFVLVAVYAILGLILVFSVFLASSTTPKLIHVNYDSIAAATRMGEAWSALQDPSRYLEKSIPQWKEQFEKALLFESGNITEPGEKEAVQKLTVLWNQYQEHLERGDASTSQQVRELIRTVINVNEQGMFGMSLENTRLNHLVLAGAVVYFLITLCLAIIFSHSLATRLAMPLKNIAEILKSKPPFGKRLKLPEPTSLEVFILTQELTHLWERVGQAERLNINEIVQEKNRLETVLESVEDSLLVVDTSGRVTHCNRLLLKLIGLKSHQVIGQLWRDLPTHREDYLKLRNFLKEDLLEGSILELRLAEQSYYYAARSRKIEGPDHAPIATLYLLHDITEKRQRDRLRTELIDLLSHELKTPLQSLGTASEILCERKQSFPEDLQILTDTIAEDIERIRAVAHEFVQVSQTQSKVLKLKLKKTALNQVIGDWLKPFMIVAKDRGIQVELIHEGSEIIYANIDSVKFPWVISNLVSNAIRFSPVNSVVQVIVTDRNQAVEIKVKDEGPGIPPEDRDRIFEPFYQSNVTTSDGNRGLFGVGLTIAKEVVEAHDGRIEYYPRDPKGSMFRILLPFPPFDLG
jgi:PAS domain S-box-containing protein